MSAAELVHDLRNMLVVVQVTGESLLRRLEPGSDAFGDASDLAQAVSRCRELTQRLAMLSDSPPVQGERVDVENALLGMQRLVARIAGPHNRVRFDLASDPCVVRADRLALERAITNLVINAAEAMPDGGDLVIATRRVRLSAQDAAAIGVSPGDYVRITVADTGAGLEREAIERIWDPGFSTRGEIGRGMGLSSVRRAVAGCGGAVAVSSTPQRGTTFVIHLPVEP